VPRSHPPTLITLARRALEQEIELQRGERILVAVSGGGDSMALLHVLARLAAKQKFSVAAHSVDHGLRPEAAAEVELVRRFAEQMGIPFTASQLALAPGSNLQARARAARYAALADAAASAGASRIATAHHADDRAETVLLRLLRGTGPHGLAVLPPRSPPRETAELVRPFVRARKADVIAHLQRHNVPHVHDPSNENPRFLRVRVRRELLPLLESLSPRIVEHLCALADDLRGHPPVVVDTSGAPVILGRSQVEALREAVRCGSPRARVRVPGGRDLAIDRTTSAAALSSDALRPASAGRRPGP
jgi:tRNA(Ile)-lysidine synthase